MRIRYIIIFLLVCLSSFAQQEKLEIQGVVVEESGQPLVGAIIYNKYNKENYVLSDLDGKFSLIVSPFARIVRISLVGFEDVELNVADIDMKEPLKITLTEELIEYNNDVCPFCPKKTMRKGESGMFKIGKYQFDLERKEIGYPYYFPVGLTGSGFAYVPFEDFDYNKKKVIIVDFIHFFADKELDHELIFRLREDKEFAMKYADRQLSQMPPERKISKEFDEFNYIVPNIYEKNGRIYYYNDESGMRNTPVKVSDSLRYVAKNIFVSPKYIGVAGSYFNSEMPFVYISYKGEQNPFYTSYMEYSPKNISEIVNRNNCPEGINKDNLQIIKKHTGENTYYVTDGYYLMYKNTIIDKNINLDNLVVVNGNFIRSGNTLYIEEKKIRKKDIFIDIECP